MIVGYTLYILVGSERTDSTMDPKRVAGMRKGLGPEGTIYTWRIEPPAHYDADLNMYFPARPGAPASAYPTMRLLFVNKWPEWTPNFPNYPSYAKKLRGLNE